MVWINKRLSHDYFSPENGVCFLRLLHIFKCTMDKGCFVNVLFFMEVNYMNPDQTAPKTQSILFADCSQEAV